jgi:hypothetical protein
MHAIHGPAPFLEDRSERHLRTEMPIETIE